MNKQLKNVIIILLSFGLGLFIIWWSVSQLTETEKTDIINAIQQANYLWILSAFFIGLLSHLSRAYRWKYLLEPLGYQTKFWNNTFAVFIGYLFNILIPRGGEVVRGSALSKYENIPFDKTFGTIIAERVVDLIMLLLIILGALFYQFDFIWGLLENKIPKNPIKLFVVFIALSISFVIFYKWFRKSNNVIIQKINHFIDGLISGVMSIRNMQNRWAFILHSFFIWGMYLLMFYVVALAIPATSNMGLGEVLSGFIGGAFGTTTNGGLGTFPFAVQKVLELYQIDSAKAYAFGWLMWLIQTGMIVVIGLLSLVLITWYNKKNVN